jgi:hypothetical protein
MSTPGDNADARDSLLRQRERDLLEVMKAAQAAIDATSDADEIAALNRALELALAALGLRMPDSSDEA